MSFFRYFINAFGSLKSYPYKSEHLTELVNLFQWNATTKENTIVTP